MTTEDIVKRTLGSVGDTKGTERSTDRSVISKVVSVKSKNGNVFQLRLSLTKESADNSDKRIIQTVNVAEENRVGRDTTFRRIYTSPESKNAITEINRKIEEVTARIRQDLIDLDGLFICGTAMFDLLSDNGITVEWEH